MTLQQSLAAHPGHSVWVSASAGTGKTKVLTDRLLRLLLEDVAPERILCITYTNAAAAEMLVRLEEKLLFWVTLEHEQLLSELTALLEVAPNAVQILRARRMFAKFLDISGGMAIQTLHGFCQNIIGNFPIEAGISTAMRVIEPGLRSLWLQEILQEILTELAADKNLNKAHKNSFAVAVREISIIAHESIFLDLVSDLERQNLAWDKSFDDIFWQNFWQKLLPTSYADESGVIADVILKPGTKAWEDLYKLANLMQKYSKRAGGYSSELLAWFHRDEQQRLSDWLEFFADVFFTKDQKPYNSEYFLTKPLIKDFPEAEKIFLSEQEKIAHAIEAIATFRLVARSKALLHFAHEIILRYRARKNASGVVDFHDMIYAAQRVFNSAENLPLLFEKLDRKIEHILLDEAQDTSPAQWEILLHILQELLPADAGGPLRRTFFVVGDIKQSIFAFQGADPYLFSANRVWSRQLFQALGHSWKEVDLTFSFRSTPEILRAVDLVVALPEFKKALAVDKEKILHLPYRAKEVGRVELWSLEEAKKNPKESWPIPDHYRYIEGKYACLAQKIADKILCWIEDGRCLQNTKIKINLSHIIILVRTRKDELMRAFQESFRQRNIPIFSPEKIILKEHLVAKDLLAWLAVMICPDDDLSLACLLKSPLYGVSEEKLFKLCFERGENSLWQTLQEKSANDEQWQRIFADISNWQKLVAFCSPQEALIKFIAADDKRSLWAAYYGVDAHAVLDEFQDLAAQYEKEFSATIQGFRQWIMQGKHALESSVDVRIEGAVRILTVHGAKGLEAPIVFLADMEEPKKPRQALECYGDTHALPLWGAEYDKSKYASIYKKSKELNQQREEEESLRLFYVAMTRARDELYMVGFSNPNPGSWYGLAMRALSPYLRNEGDAMVLEL